MDAKEPIAIVGIGCRFPGDASNPQKLWQLLANGVDAISDVPKSRWDSRKYFSPEPKRPGKTYAMQGGFLTEKIDHFDPLAFGISPREAEELDPQQRLLLEVTWEAFEDAGCNVTNLKGSSTGVYIGGFCLDNMLLRFNSHNRHLSRTHTATSSTMTMLANRISHYFDFRGPSITIDTACSSSLVAIHYACQGIWNREVDVAITGGVNIMLKPEFPIVMSKGNFLSPHSRCMAFDTRASGYARGEGAGILLLKKLSTAKKDGDKIYALLKMTGVNQDGHTPGITFPNTSSQEALIRTVYDQAKISPSKIDYIEAHGTGTQAGDPAELNALTRILSEGKRTKPFLIGSIKTNIGHLEAAAGVAGVIKAALCLQNREIPPNLHLKTLNPKFSQQDDKFKVPTQLEKWPTDSKKIYAGVNSFGYGGTNAHALLENYCINDELIPNNPPIASESKTSIPQIFPLSAHSEKALQDLAGKLAFYLSRNPKALINDLLYTFWQRRTHHPHRIAVRASSVNELKTKFQLFSIGESDEAIISGKALSEKYKKIVFVFTGMGPQWWAMGRKLFQTQPTYRHTVENCDRLFQSISGWSIIEELQRDETQSRISKTEIAQPANFILQKGLSELWLSWGILPHAVVGHSVGEIAAAHVSGALSLEDALKISYHRSLLQSQLAGKGTMLAIGLPLREAEALLKHNSNVSVAAINSYSSVTLAGDEASLQKISSQMDEKGIFAKFLKVEIAYHSHQMDEIKPFFYEALRDIKPTKSTIPYYSTVVGSEIPGEELNCNYWWSNVRQPVIFADTLSTLIDKDFYSFIEIGPHPVLRTNIKEISHFEKNEVLTFSSLNRNIDDITALENTLADIYVSGILPASSIFTTTNGNNLTLPTYPWQRERYWLESEKSIADRIGCADYVYFHKPLTSSKQSWEVELNPNFFPYLEDHIIDEKVIFPGAAYIDIGLSLSDKTRETSIHSVCNLKLVNFLDYNADKLRNLCTEFDPESGNFKVFSNEIDSFKVPVLHAKGRVSYSLFQPGTLPIDLNSIEDNFSRSLEKDTLYEKLREKGLTYGERFRLIEKAHFTSNSFLGKLSQTSAEKLKSEADYFVSPTILDAAFQIIPFFTEENAPVLPTFIRRATIYKKSKAINWVFGNNVKQIDNSLFADLYLLDDQKNVVGEVKSFQCQVFPRKLNLSDNISFQIKWAQADLPKTPPSHSKTCLLIEPSSGSAPGLVDYFKANSEFPVFTYRLSSDNKNKLVNPLDGKVPSPYRDLAKTLKKNHITKLIFLPGSSEPQKDIHDLTLEKFTSPIVSLSHLVKALEDEDDGLCAELIFVTKNSVITENEKVVQFDTTPLTGVLRLIENEFSSYSCKLIDFDKLIYKSDFNLLFSETINDNDDSEVAYRNSTRYVRKISPLRMRKNKTNEEKRTYSFTETPLRLVPRKDGYIDSLQFQKFSLPRPSKSEITIKTSATSLNFKDVLKVYNRLDSQVTQNTFFGDNLGMEISGIVTEVGSNVSEFKAGDEVVAITPHNFSSYQTIGTQYVFKKPSHMSHEESTSLIVFLTAYQALCKLANISPYEKVLIHNATGGVGLAAVQIAKWKKAEIFATAGNDNKRKYLRSIGIKHVMDSRSISFAEEIMSATKNEGVNIILNTLSGESLEEGIRVLAPYGRFIELGKKDISEANSLSLQAFNNNLTFSSLDIDRMLLERVDLTRSSMEELLHLFENRKLLPLPHKCYDAHQIKEAFQLMAQGEHIGKVTIRFRNKKVEISTPKIDTPLFKNDASYLITGGNSGIGLEIAKWMATRGAKHLILASRSGIQSQHAKTIVREIESLGASVSVPHVDVSNFQEVEALVKGLKKTKSPPLNGIFHCALVLKDSYLSELTSSELESVLAPKVMGAINLHIATKESPLDFFICFSSISALIGNIGQTSYIAANAFLDIFATWRRNLGLPGLSINLGAFSDSGVLTRNKTAQIALKNTGIIPLNKEQLFASLQEVISIDQSQIGIFLVQWEKWKKIAPKASKSSFFSEIFHSSDSNGEENSETKLKYRALTEELSNLEGEKRKTHLEKIISSSLSEILKIPISKINNHDTPDALGVDSLMSLELVLNLKMTTGIELSTLDLIKKPTISELAQQLLDKNFEFE